MNRLKDQRSLYLRHAAEQKIDWYPWGDQAFEAARRENKPVFLSTGAAWCHWCHVMARENFEDPEVAAFLNGFFISVKLDRDERPDIDRRYQQAVAAMGGGSGWPLNVFLTPDREPFFGGTYFPRHEQHGRPGFLQVLAAVRNLYGTEKSEVVSYAGSVLRALEPDPLVPRDPSPGLLDRAEHDMLASFDRERGGFGTSPKFPMPGAIEFLLRRFAFGSSAAGDAAHRTLLAMAAGGFHDQLGGGFHRYSVDDAWIVPHFEKMADDNAGLLECYSGAAGLFSDLRFRQAAEGIIRFTQTELSDSGGGFYASQDADVTPDDEGGYFTWTENELREVLSPLQYQVLSRHLLSDRGVMHHDPAKRVLAINRTLESIAEELGMDGEVIAEAIRSGKEVLAARRLTRPRPLVDGALYPSLNGMMSAAYFRASMAFAEPRLRDFALKGVARIMAEHWNGKDLDHAPDVPGLLEDYVHLVHALLGAYETSGDRRHLATAEKMMARCEEKFLDRAAGGFFDTAEDVPGPRQKSIEDIPHPSANSVAIMALLKLSSLTGNEAYRNEAERSLRLFSDAAAELGIHAGGYFCGLHAAAQRSVLTVEASPDSRLAQEARTAAVRFFAPVRYGPDNGRVIACIQDVCLPPAYSPEELMHLLTACNITGVACNKEQFLRSNI